MVMQIRASSSPGVGFSSPIRQQKVMYDNVPAQCDLRGSSKLYPSNESFSACRCGSRLAIPESCLATGLRRQISSRVCGAVVIAERSAKKTLDSFTWRKNNMSVDQWTIAQGLADRLKRQRAKMSRATVMRFHIGSYETARIRSEGPYTGDQAARGAGVAETEDKAIRQACASD